MQSKLIKLSEVCLRLSPPEVPQVGCTGQAIEWIFSFLCQIVTSVSIATLKL